MHIRGEILSKTQSESLLIGILHLIGQAAVDSTILECKKVWHKSDMEKTTFQYQALTLAQEGDSQR